MRTHLLPHSGSGRRPLHLEQRYLYAEPGILIPQLMKELIVGTTKLTTRPGAAAPEGCASLRGPEGERMPASGAGRC